MQQHNSENHQFETKCLRAGFKGDSNRAHNTPISISSTFYYDNTKQGERLFSGLEEGFVYERFGNPNSSEVELKIAALETHGIQNIQVKAILHASGQAAHSTLFFSFLSQGDKILASFPAYGGTQDLLNMALQDKGVQHEFVNLKQLENLEEKLQTEKNIKLIHIETPCNPLTLCFDIQQISDLAHKYGVKVSVDNTFATPYLQQPFKFGADFVVHSTTKFLNGLGTATGGILIGKDLEFMNKKALKYQRTFGNNSNGLEAFLLNQGLKTLHIRMEKHCENAKKIAEFLLKQKKVQKVWYLGDKSHPDHQLAKKQMSNFGAIISFELEGGYDSCIKFMDKLNLCIRAVSLGTADTLICHPSSTTHVQVPKEIQLNQGITPGLLRISVGIEHHQDIINDIQQALN